jgi:hypothetical protein
MNPYRDDIQGAIALLGDHMARVQLIARNLAESRDLDELDPETELAIVCWLEEAGDALHRPDLWRRHVRPQR